MNINNTYLGFTDNKKPMQAARIEKSLDMLWRMENGVFSRKQIVYDYLLNGYRPSIEENYTYYSARLDDYTKPKTLYKLEDDNGYLEINKTLYDFANYILEKDFLNKEKVSKFIQNEIAEKEEQERLEQEKLERKRKEEEEKRQQEELESKERARMINEKYSKLGREFINRLGYDPIKKILDKYLPEFYKIVEEQDNVKLTQDKKEKFYNERYDSLLYTLGHNGLCIDMMKGYAEDYERDYFNRYELANIYLFLDQQLLFEVYSNVELTDKPITITAKMKAVYDGREYKGSKKAV